MKDVTRWTVVDYNYFLQVPAKLVQVLNVISAMVHARFSEESRPKNIPPEMAAFSLLRSTYVQTFLLVK